MMIVGSSGNASKTLLKKTLGLLLDKTGHLLPLLTSVVIALPTKINKTWQLRLEFITNTLPTSTCMPRNQENTPTPSY